MSWRTPCVEDPEAWVSDKPDQRWAALQACRTCHILEQCAAKTVDPDERIGVRGGVDWTVSKNTGLSLAPASCRNPRCRRTILQHATGRRREFCNDKCRTTARTDAA